MSDKPDRKKLLIILLMPIFIIVAYFILNSGNTPETNTDISTPATTTGSKKSWKNISADKRAAWLKSNIVKSQSDKTKKEAEKLLKELDVEAVPLLLDLGKDKKYSHAVTNRLRVLAQNKEIKEALYSETKADDAEEVILAVRALLPKQKDERYLDMVLSLLNSKNPDVVADMLQILQIKTLQSDKAVDVLLGMFPGQQFKDYRLVNALGHQGSNRAVEPLTNHYNSIFDTQSRENAVRRAAIIEALGNIGTPESLESISKIPVSEEHDIVLMTAIESINRIAGQNVEMIRNDNPAVMNTLISLLESDRHNLYDSANAALSVITGKTVELKSNATPEEAKEAASQWRELINN